jgi:hypothetical protein
MGRQKPYRRETILLSAAVGRPAEPGASDLVADVRGRASDWKRFRYQILAPASDVRQ